MIDSLQGCFRLNDGHRMPGYGLGVFRAANGPEVSNAVSYAIGIGYRLIDTATFYHNEDGVGKGVRDSGIPRDQIFLTTKLWPTDFPRIDEVFAESMRLLGTDYVDLYLMHWPGTDTDLRLRTWDRMQELKDEGKIRSIGVSNFYVHHLDELIDRTGIMPTVDQVECHPWQQQRAIREYCNPRDIVVQAWGPLLHGHLSEEPLLEEIGRKYEKTAAQVALRWEVQSDIATIPKSVHPERIASNADIFDFSLSEDDMERIDELDGKGAFAYDADTFTGIK